MRSLMAGLRASGKGSAARITPTRMSTFRKSSKVIVMARAPTPLCAVEIRCGSLGYAVGRRDHLADKPFKARADDIDQHRAGDDGRHDIDCLLVVGPHAHHLQWRGDGESDEVAGHAAETDPP